MLQQTKMLDQAVQCQNTMHQMKRSHIIVPMLMDPRLVHSIVWRVKLDLDRILMIMLAMIF